MSSRRRRRRGPQRPGQNNTSPASPAAPAETNSEELTDETLGEEDLPGVARAHEDDEAAPRKKPATDSPEETAEKLRALEEQGRLTALHRLVSDLWGGTTLSDDQLKTISYFADPDSAKATDTGFELTLHNGRKIQWGVFPDEDGAPVEAIRGEKRGFDQNAAQAIITLARIRGWETLDITGKKDHKDMLWLAMHRQNLEDRKNFEREKLLGLRGAEEEFTPKLSSANYTPAADSVAYQTAMNETHQVEYLIAAARAALAGAMPEAPAQTTTSAADEQTPGVAQAPPAAPAPVQAATPAAPVATETAEPANPVKVTVVKVPAGTEPPSPTSIPSSLFVPAPTAAAPEAPSVPAPAAPDEKAAPVAKTGDTAPAAPVVEETAAPMKITVVQAPAGTEPASVTSLPTSMFVAPATTEAASQTEAAPATDQRSKFAAAVEAKGGHRKKGSGPAPDTGRNGPAPKTRKDADPGRKTPPRGSSKAKGQQHRR